MRRTVPVFLRRDGYTAPLQNGLWCLRRRVCVVDCTPANGTLFSLYNGVRVCCRYAIRFFVPPALPLIPGSPLPISICASS